LPAYLQPKLARLTMLCRTVLLLALAGHLSHAWPSGAPESVCDSFTPQHDARAQVTQAPYTLEVSNNLVSTGSSVTVTLKSAQSNTPFAGFFVKAVSPTGTRAIGSFSSSENGIQFRDCAGTPQSAATHTSNNRKTQSVLSWTAPSGLNSEVIFVATVVYNKTTFWENVRSSGVQVTATSGTPGSAFDVSTTPPSSSEESALYAGCGKTKGCYGGPAGGCVGNKNCDFLVTYRQMRESVVFQLMGKTNGYVALGLSTDNKMGEDSVTQCVYNRQRQDIQGAQSYNPGKNNQALSNPDEGLQVNASASMYVDGRVICEFTRVGQQTISGKEFNLINDFYYLLIAVGGASSRTELQPHNIAPVGMWVSSTNTKVTDTEVLGSGASTRYLITIHVLLLLSSLCFLYSNSMF